MALIIRVFGMVLMTHVACVSDPGVDNTGAQESTTTDAALVCVAAMESDIVVTMSPTMFGGTETTLHEECTVSNVVDDEPAQLEMTCPNGLGTIDWALEVSSLSIPLSDVFFLEQVVDLRYHTAGGAGLQPRWNQWAIVALPQQDTPLLVAASVEGKLPGTFGSPLVWSHAFDTTCDEQMGSCGLGVMRRVALEFSLGDDGSTVIFDQNEGEVGPYLVRVGDAFYDEGNCEGGSENWYEFVVISANPM